MSNVLDVLKERGFVEQVSDEEGLHEALEHPITCYVGYDPSAPSLHIGHLLTLMALAHMQRHGHRPIAVIGGGTGMIGDPSGRTEMRQILTPERIQTNLDSLREQIGRFIDLSEGQGLILDNADWLGKLNYIEFLRDIGVHFSVNRMLAAETYRTRLETGLSFLEFNYQVLQAYDFLYLYQHYDCILQMGGNDQWGNIVAGVDLIRRVTGGQAYALTLPLLTTASGAKMGKTAAGAVWLDAKLVSPYDFYQYWINVDDADVTRFLKIFTFLPLEEIERLGEMDGADIRSAKEVLAYEVTRLVHGERAAAEARETSRRLFQKGASTAAVIEAGAVEIPTITIEANALQEGVAVSDLFFRAGLAKSKSEARRLVQQGGAYINDQVVESVDRLVTTEDLQGGSLLLRSGKKRYRRLTVI